MHEGACMCFANQLMKSKGTKVRAYMESKLQSTICWTPPQRLQSTHQHCDNLW